METSSQWRHLLVGLLLSGLLGQSSFAFPRPHGQYEPQPAHGQSSKHALAHPERGAPARTVRLTCHPDSVELVIKADMFGVGAPVDHDELRLGPEDDDYCKAAASSSGDEYRIVAGLTDCGTKHWITKDSLVYTNLLVYSPVSSPYGLIRMDAAAVPIECHYQRKYALSSSPLVPAWVSFTSAQAAVETLKFDLSIMTSDWLHKRSSSVFYLGEPISIEASVAVGRHVGLRVFMNDCVATRHPDVLSVPRYVFIQNGCLTDSQISGSRSHFLPRTQEHKLRLVIDAFRFHNEDVGQLYITCQLNAGPVSYSEAANKACTFSNKRWQSADDNDYLCRYCQSQAGQTLGPRGFGKPEEPEALWRSGLNTNNVWEQEARVGPLLVSPGKYKSGPLPVEEHAPELNKLSRLVPYGSEWRSGVIDKTDQQKGLFPLSTPDLVDEDDDQSETNLNDVEKALIPSSPWTPAVVKETDDKTGIDIKDLKKGLFPLLPSTPELLEDKDESGADLIYPDVEKALILGSPWTPDVLENYGKTVTDIKDLEKQLLPSLPPALKENDEEEEAAAPQDQTIPVVMQKAKFTELDNNVTADVGDVGPTTQVKLDATLLSNEPIQNLTSQTQTTQGDNE